MRQSFSFIAFLLCCSMIIGTAFLYPKWEKKQTETTLSWDVMGYYLYLPATIIYKDIKTLSFKDAILSTYRPTSSFYQAFRQDDGNYVMKYPIGMAILYFPFFLIGHLFATVLGYPIDGFSPPYQIAISWGSIGVAFIGLWTIRKALLFYFSDLIVSIVLVLLVFGTHYLNYTAIDGGMPHNWIFTLVAVLIWQTIRWYQKPSVGNSFLIACCIGLAALSRPTDILVALIPIFWGLKDKEALRDRFRFWKTHAHYLFFIIGIVTLIGSIQLGYWKYVSGNWLVYSYQDQGFSWFPPHIKNVLISYRKGWLVYTPIMVVALFGFWSMYKRYSFLLWGVLIYFIGHFYITAAWDIWWYGGGFGQRALIQAYPILLFPMAAFLENIFNSIHKKKGQVEYIAPKFYLASFTVFACFCIWLNCFQTYQAHGAGFETEAMTKAYYWRIFGNANPTKLDRKLLDTREDFIGERTNIHLAFETDFENIPNIESHATETALSGNRVLLSNAANEFTPAINIPLPSTSHRWLRIHAQFYTPEKESNVWQMTQMIAQFKKRDEVIKKRMIRIQRQVEAKSWQSNWMDMKIPQKDFDTLSIIFWNAGSNKTLYIDDLKVELYD